MANKKTDLEQLKGILEQFDPKTIQQALEEAPCRKSFKDFGDPGAKVQVGSDSHVATEEIAYLERIIHEFNLLPVHFLEEGAVVQRAVARVTRNGSAWGTGFLVSPSLFMTNNHIIPSVAFAQTQNVAMQFNYQLDYMGNTQTPEVYTPNLADVFHTNPSLDFTLIRLNQRCRWVFYRDYWRTRIARESGEDVYETLIGPQPIGTGSIGLPITRVCTIAGESWGYLRLPGSNAYALREHLNIVQHPQGRRKEVALQKNNITDIYTNRIRYTTDTDPGSSGSPVFNNQWDLVAIHHAAGERREPWDPDNPVWLSNEGMRMDKIVADLRSHYSGDPILTELGI